METTCLKNGTCACLKKLRNELCIVRDELFNTLKNKEDREKMPEDLQLLDSGTIRSLNGVLDTIDKLLTHKSTPLWTGLKK